jgi:hypothetical protein
VYSGVGIEFLGVVEVERKATLQDGSARILYLVFLPRPSLVGVVDYLQIAVGESNEE